MVDGMGLRKCDVRTSLIFFFITFIIIFLMTIENHHVNVPCSPLNCLCQKQLSSWSNTVVFLEIVIESIQ